MRSAIVTIHLENLAHNYHLLQQAATKSSIMAVVKANAYGHGILPITETLFNEGCRNFAVTDSAEAVKLWESLLPQMRHKVEITILSGLFDLNDARAIQHYDFSPVISTVNQFEQLQQVNFKGTAWLKVDTGMGRMGSPNLKEIYCNIGNSPIQLAGIMSHLACADTPNHPLNTQQIKRFQQIQRDTNAPAYSLFNSAGLIAFADDVPTDVIRPGIALYGVEPIPSKPLGLKPVMQLSAKVLHIKTIQAEDSVSYGATWTAAKTTQVAIVSLGYADGLPRLLSNQGEALHASGRLPIVGKVCMDYCMLAIGNQKVSVGDDVIFFGSHASPSIQDVANLCQTITYEIFTGINTRVKRHYIKGAL